MSVAGGMLIALLLLAAGGLAALAWSFSGRMIARRTPNTRTSPADHGLPFEEVAFQARDGVPLRGWFIPAPQARGTVVFCHGHAGSMDPDVQYAPWFHQAGLNVLMFDFRGHGRSDGERVSMGALERQDLLGAMDYLAGRGIERAGVLGFSMGGVVAILTAPLDERIVAVASDQFPPNSEENFEQQTHNFSSFHPSGTNFLLADGHVQMITETIDLAVYRAMCTREGGEPVGMGQ